MMMRDPAFMERLKRRAKRQEAAAQLAALEANAHVLAWRQTRQARLHADAVAAVPKPGVLPRVGRSDAEIVVERRVENPYRSDQQVEDQLRSIGLDNQALPGLIKADIRLASLIGGLCRVHGRTEAQTLAAAHYRMLWERSHIGGARAIDYGVVRVDVSGISQGAFIEIGADARGRYMAAVQLLGMVNSRWVELVVCEGHTLRALAHDLGEGQGGAAFERAKSVLFDLVDRLVEHFGYSGGTVRRRLRGDGAAPKAFSGVVINRRLIVAEVG